MNGPGLQLKRTALFVPKYYRLSQNDLNSYKFLIIYYVPKNELRYAAYIHQWLRSKIERQMSNLILNIVNTFTSNKLLPTDL